MLPCHLAAAFMHHHNLACTSTVRLKTPFCAHKPTVQKGDRFETDCYYDTDLSSVGSDNVTFGLGSENEM